MIYVHLVLCSMPLHFDKKRSKYRQYWRITAAYYFHDGAKLLFWQQRMQILLIIVMVTVRVTVPAVIAIRTMLSVIDGRYVMRPEAAIRYCHF
jgi:hypothetical protein